MLAVDKGMENWGNVPHEQKRLFDLLRKHKAHHTFAISGDVHFAELSKTDMGGYPFYDLTSSGLSHTSKSWALANNSFRVGESHWELNAGLIEIDWDKRTVELAIINPDGRENPAAPAQALGAGIRCGASANRMSPKSRHQPTRGEVSG